MIKFVCFDFDGVFTDGDISINDNYCIKKYNVKDGMGIKLLKNNNIKCGIISNFKINSNLNEIVKHLGIDYYYQGSDNKIDILNNWLDIEKINIDNVAYIGDDINDLNIINLVGYSACPADAIDIIKSNVNYVCNYKGGCGCVREFIELILNEYEDSLNVKSQLKRSILHTLNKIQSSDFLENKLINCKGNIFVSGIGKSDDLSIYFCNLMKSIGLPAFNINIQNITHGDLGCIKDNDIIIFISKSGNTQEIINIIDLIKCFKVGICCNEKSKFVELCDYTHIVPHKEEIINSKNINCIPSNSFLSLSMFIIILINNLIEKLPLTLDNYRQFHLGGNIGNKYKKISDIIIKDYPKIILNKDIKLNDVLLEMTKYSIGCCFFINNNNHLIGVMSDGDIRRLLVNNNLDIYNNINVNFEYIENQNLYLKDVGDYKKFKFIPILNEKDIIGIIDVRDLHY